MEQEMIDVFGNEIDERNSDHWGRMVLGKAVADKMAQQQPAMRNNLLQPVAVAPQSVAAPAPVVVPAVQHKQTVRKSVPKSNPVILAEQSPILAAGRIVADNLAKRNKVDNTSLAQTVDNMLFPISKQQQQPVTQGSTGLNRLDKAIYDASRDFMNWFSRLFK